MTVKEVAPGRVPRKAGVAVSEFNAAITAKLADGAIDALTALGVDDVVVARVGGALELGLVASALLSAGCEVVVAVGAVIKGETDHYEFVAGEVSRALAEVGLRSGRPVGNAVLTVREYQHAVERALPGPSNKGAEAASAAVKAFTVLSGLGEIQ